MQWQNINAKNNNTKIFRIGGFEFAYGAGLVNQSTLNSEKIPPFSKSKNLQSLKKYDVCDGPERFAERVFWSSAFAAEEHVRTQISLIFIKNTHSAAVQRGNCNFVIVRQITFFENIAQRICYNLCYYLCYYVCYNHMLIFILLFL